MAQWWEDYESVEESELGGEQSSRALLLKTQSFENLNRVPDYVFIPSREDPQLGQPVYLCEMHGSSRGKRTIRLGFMPNPSDRRACALMLSNPDTLAKEPVIRVKTSRLKKQHQLLQRSASEDRFLDVDESSRSSASSADSSPGPLRRSDDDIPASSFRPIASSSSSSTSAFHSVVLTRKRHAPEPSTSDAPAEKRSCPTPAPVTDEEPMHLETPQKQDDDEKETLEVPSFYCLCPITRGELDVERMRWLISTRTSCLRQLLCIRTRSTRDRRYQVARVIEPLLRLSDDEYALSYQHMEMFVLSLLDSSREQKFFERLMAAEREVLSEKMYACKSTVALERMLLRGGMLGLQRSDDELDEAWVARYGKLYESEESMSRLSVRRVVFSSNSSSSSSDSLIESLRQCHLSAAAPDKPPEEFPHAWYVTDWRNALDGVSNRRVLLFRGQAYMCEEDLKRYAADRFAQESRRRIAFYRERLWRCGTDDERLQDLRMMASYELTVLRKHTERSDRERVNGLVDLEDLLASGPLCMVHLDRRLMREHHLKHHERQQYAMTAIKSGCSAASVTRRWFGGTRWRHKSATLDPEKLERQTTQDYENYERKKNDYSGLSCYRINERDATGRTVSAYSCPYSQLKREELGVLLRTEPNPVSAQARESILRVATQQRDPVTACNTHLKARIDAARKRSGSSSSNSNDGEEGLVRIAPISHTDAYYARLRQHVSPAALKHKAAAAAAPPKTVFEKLCPPKKTTD